MGRSSSCFKIITCGSDSADKDDLDASESNNSSYKRGWSFQKRSATHRVLSNIVISETPSSVNKESPESTGLNFQQPPPNSAVPDKISAQCTDDKAQLLTLVNSNISEDVVATEKESKVDVILEESVAIIIQTAIRGFLAQRELLKHKNVVKLQAALRGHLVRRDAVGTLRCVQAIVKMQSLVRARRARMSLEGSYTKEKLNEKHGKDDYGSTTLVKGNSVTKSDVTYTSIEKLLSNRFARQLLDSTPKTNSINVKCDSSKPNSAWKWLERWMSVSTPDIAQPQQPDQQEREDEESPSQVEAQITSAVSCESADLKSGIRETAVQLGKEEDLITCDDENLNFQACHPTSSVRENLEELLPENTVSSVVKETLPDINSLPNKTMQSDANSQLEIKSLPSNPKINSELPNYSTKRLASEQLETEEKKINPAFISTQSKFEVLGSTENSVRSISLSYQDVGVESNTDTVSSGADTIFRTKDLNIGENSVPSNSRVQVVGSDCGPELSISSTFDSPDIAEVGATEIYDHDAKASEERTCNPISEENLEVEGKDVSSVPVSSLSYSSDPPEKLDVNSESLNSIVPVDSQQIEKKPERSASDLQTEMDTETIFQAHRPSPEASPRSHITVPESQAHRSSPEASPRSHITIPESQGTPSSLISVKAKRNTSEKSGSGQKRKSLSAGKKSLPNPNHDSGPRSSTELPNKDLKNGKRLGSLGSGPNHIDQEPRESNSSNSLPRFMQATESARAKVYANNSPRSSPDAQDRDIYSKKRHSLPGANGRQGSPHIQRSISQAQQGAKGSGLHPHERKWQR